jgi:hypothetical protein
MKPLVVVAVEVLEQQAGQDFRPPELVAAAAGPAAMMLQQVIIILLYLMDQLHKEIKVLSQYMVTMVVLRLLIQIHQVAVVVLAALAVLTLVAYVVMGAQVRSGLLEVEIITQVVGAGALDPDQPRRVMVDLAEAVMAVQMLLPLAVLIPAVVAVVVDIPDIAIARKAATAVQA